MEEMKKPAKKINLDELKKKYGKDPIKSPAKTVKKIVKPKPPAKKK